MCTLDGVPYFTLDMDKIPAGYASVDVRIDDVPCKMVAGHVAAAVSSSTSISGASKSAIDCPGFITTAQYDTVRPAPQWFLYELADKPRWGYEEENAERLKELMKKWDERRLRT